MSTRGPTGIQRFWTVPHPHESFRAALGAYPVSLLRRRAAAFAELAMQPSVIEERLADLLRHQTGRRPSPSEMRSWTGSLPILAQDLMDAGLDNVEVMLEYRLPLTSKRADVVLAGRHPRTGDASYVVVELKQWSKAELFDSAGELVTVAGAPGPPRLHPVAQVRRYCEYLTDFTSVLHDQADPMAGAAYLHNAGSDVQQVLGGYPQTSMGRLFTGADRGGFLDFLRSRLDQSAAGAPYADQILRSAVAPSRQLLKVAAEEIAGREQFVLLDEQAVAVDMVLHAVETARQSDTKSVIVISGGPGSGKSVIALSLLGKLAERGRTAIHATGSRSFTITLRKVSGRKSDRATSLFKYFNQFTEADRNGLDVLILDEAHRVRATSENRYTRAEARIGRPQVDELIAAARVPVFLLLPSTVGSAGADPQSKSEPKIGAVHRLEKALHFVSEYPPAPRGHRPIIHQDLPTGTRSVVEFQASQLAPLL